MTDDKKLELRGRAVFALTLISIAGILAGVAIAWLGSPVGGIAAVVTGSVGGIVAIVLRGNGGEE